MDSITTPLIDPDKERCANCFYSCRNWSSSESTCDYILATGHRRACPAGVKCKRYKKAKDGKHWSETQRRRDSSELYNFVTKGGNKQKEKDKEKNNA